jgi:hypothetical protein
VRCLLLHRKHASAQKADLAVSIIVDPFVAVGIAYVQLSAAAALKRVAKQVPDTALCSALMHHVPGLLKLCVLLILSNINVHFRRRCDSRDKD